MQRAHAVHPVAALQSEYSLWTRDPEEGMLSACRQLNVAFVAYSPLGRGFLTGALTDTKQLGKGDFRATNPRFQEENLTRNLRLLDTVKDIATRRRCTLGQVALSWLLAQGDDIIPIPGTRRKKYLDENVSTIGVELASEDLAVLSETFSEGVVIGERYSAEGMKGVNV